MLTVALPNGNLRKMTEKIFAKAGINLPTEPSRKHWIKVRHPLVSKIVWIKARDIPWFVQDSCHLHEPPTLVGITGNDCYEEWVHAHSEQDRFFPVLGELPYGESSLQRTKIALISHGSRTRYSENAVVTEFPNWTRFLLGGHAHITPVTGSVEAFVHPEGYYFGVTHVETGRSLKHNNLHIVKVLAYTSPHIYVHPSFEKMNLVRDLGELLQGGLWELNREADRRKEKEGK